MADDIIIKVSLEGAQKEINNLAKIQANIDKLGGVKKSLARQEKDLVKAIQESGDASGRQVEALNKVRAKQEENTIALKLNKDQQRENRKAVLSNQKAQNSKIGSLERMKHQLSIDTAALNKFTIEEIKNDKVAQKLAKRIAKTTEELKKQEAAVGNNRRNVGNYGEAVNDVLPIMGGFGMQIQTLQRSFTAIQGAISKATAIQKTNAVATKQNAVANTQMSASQRLMAATTGGVNKSLKLFKIALISTGVGAIVIALGTLIAALASTQKGMDAVNRVLEPIKETFATLFGIIQDVGLKVFDQLKTAISNPKDALKSLGNAIKQNIINRFTGAVDLVKAQGKFLVSTFKLIGLGIKKALANVPLLGAGIDQEALAKDLKQAKSEAIKNAKDVARALIQVNTGLSVEQQRSAVQLTKTLSAEGKKRIAEAIERGKQIADLEREIEEAAISLSREKAKANREFETQKEIAQNILKTDKERLQAVEDAKVALKQVASIQQDQLKREIKLATLRTKANDTDNEAKKELSDLQGQLDEVAAAEIKKRILLGNLGNTIVKKRIALNKKAADDALKELEKLDKARTKAAENDVKRQSEKESEIIDNKIKQLELEQQLELATKEHTEEEKFKLAIELERKLGALRLEQNALQSAELLKKEEDLNNKILNLKKASKGKETVEIIQTQDLLDATIQEKEKIQGEALANIKLENKIKENEILSEEDTRVKEENAEKKAEDDAKELEALKAKEDNKKAIKDSIIQAGEDVQKEIFKNQNRRIDEGLSRDIDALNLKREAGEISEEEFNKKRLALDKQAFKERKRLSLAQIVIDFAVAAGKTLASTGIAGLPLLIPLGIQGAAQAAIVASQKFADGGLLEGASHAFGGIPLGNNQEGEGGEAIINKRSTAKHLPLLSAINQDGGGVALGGVASPNTGALSKFANGGIINNTVNQGSSIDLQDLESRIAASINTIKVQNVASETSEVANRVEQIQASASF